MMLGPQGGNGRKKYQLAGVLIFFFVAVVPLSALFIYLLTYDYRVVPESGGAEEGYRPRREISGLKSEVFARPASLHGRMLCEVEIRNEGPWKVRLLDCVNPGKILNFSLVYLGESGESPAEKLNLRPGMEDAFWGRGGFSEMEDAVVDLLPGSSWRKRIELDRFFDIGRRGVYELTVSYDPHRAVGGGAAVPAGAEQGTVSARPVRFEIGRAAGKAGPDSEGKAAPGAAKAASGGREAR
jgi:hypothetical protein